MSEQKKWDSVYANCEPSQLPWFNLPIVEKTKDFLAELSARDLLVVTGCGIGDTVNQLSQFGICNIIGTDISSVAINNARRRFPKSQFENYPTQELRQQYIQPVTVIDWLNLHQIRPEDLPAYLSSLQKISSKLLIAYFYGENEPMQKHSIAHSEMVYNYNPATVSQLLLPLRKISEERFTLQIKVNSILTNFETVKQIYVR